MAWFDDLNLPGSTVTGHFAFVTADGPDEDDFPDVMLASGTVTFEPTAKAVRAGGAWVGISPVTAQVFDGELVISEEDPRPVRILSTDADTGVDGWGWTAHFSIDDADLKPIRFRAPESGVHLTGDDLIPITGQPVEVIEGADGASVTGARDNGDQTVSFLLSDGTETDPVAIPPGPAGVGIASISDPDAESLVTITYTDGTTTTVQAIRGAPGDDGHTPTIGWDGTALIIDGETGPDLKGEPGADSTVPGPPGEATLPDTGRRRITDLLTLPDGITVGEAYIHRIGPIVTIEVTSVLTSIPRGSIPVSLPPGFESTFTDARAVAAGAYPVNVKNGTIRFYAAVANGSTANFWGGVYATAEPWPTTLPGTPA